MSIYDTVLRDYQRAGIDGLRDGFVHGHNRQVLVIPTGGGKTEMACAIAELAKSRGNHTWFIVDRKVLSSQTRARFESYGLTCSVLQGDNTVIVAGADVTVATVQTLRSRLKDVLGKADFSLLTGNLLVFDEVHQFHQFHRDMLDARPDLPCIGLTATPHHGSLGQYFSHVVAPVTIKALIEQEYLVPFRIFQPAPDIDLSGVRIRAGEYVESDLEEKMSAITGDIVTHWVQHGEKRPTIAFCVNVAHAREVAQEFQRSGVSSGVVVAGTPDEERQELFERLRTGRIRVLCSVMVLGVGFDLPEAACAILARPTASEALHIQQCGRVARVAVNKRDALILDHAGNTLAHGLPQNYIPPPLDAVDTSTTRSRALKDKAAIRCGDCGYILEPGQQICPNCLAEREQTSQVIVKAGRLVETDSLPVSDPTCDPGYRRQMFQEWVGYFEAQPTSKNPRGRAAFCFQHYFGSPPWEDSAIGSRYKTIQTEPFSVESKQMAVRFTKHGHALRRGQEKKLLREVTAALPSPDSCHPSISRLDCSHPHQGVYAGTGPHAAQRRCKACGQFLGWVSRTDLAARQSAQ